MKWSMGKGTFGQVEEVLDTSWDEFAQFLADAANRPRDPAMRDDSWWCAPFLVPRDVPTRREEDVRRMANWLAMDCDHGNVSLTEIKYKLCGTGHIAYSTTHAQADDMRWRILVHLDRETSPNEYRRCWRWFGSRFHVDPKTSNVSRIYFMPAAWDNAANVFWHQPGGTIKVDSILALVPEQIMPPLAPPQTTTQHLPQGTPIVTPYMLAAAQAAPEGGRLFHLMVQAAVRCRLNGWELHASGLAHAAFEASQIFAPGKARPGIQREAERAIAWANAHHTPQSPLEKMRNRILFEDARRQERVAAIAKKLSQ